MGNIISLVLYLTSVFRDTDFHDRRFTILGHSNLVTPDSVAPEPWSIGGTATRLQSSANRRLIRCRGSREPFPESFVAEYVAEPSDAIRVLGF